MDKRLINYYAEIIKGIEFKRVIDPTTLDGKHNDLTLRLNPNYDLTIPNNFSAFKDELKELFLEILKK